MYQYQIILLIALSGWALAAPPVEQVPSEKSTVPTPSIWMSPPFAPDTPATPVKGPVERPPPVAILDSSHDKHEDGSYSFHFHGEDGTFREESAIVRDAGTKHEHLEVTGSYSYFDVDGNEVVVHYTANDRGFVPVGGNINEEIKAAAKLTSEQVYVQPLSRETRAARNNHHHHHHRPQSHRPKPHHKRKY